MFSKLHLALFGRLGSVSAWPRSPWAEPTRGSLALNEAYKRPPRTATQLKSRPQPLATVSSCV